MIETLVIVVGGIACAYFAGEHLYSNYINKEDIKEVSMEPGWAPQIEEWVELPPPVGNITVTKSDHAEVSFSDINLNVEDFNSLPKFIRSIITKYVNNPDSASEDSDHFLIGDVKMWKIYNFDIYKPAKYNMSSKEMRVIKEIYKDFKKRFPKKTSEYKIQQALDNI